MPGSGDGGLLFLIPFLEEDTCREQKVVLGLCYSHLCPAWCLCSRRGWKEQREEGGEGQAGAHLEELGESGNLPQALGALSHSQGSLGFISHPVVTECQSQHIGVILHPFSQCPRSPVGTRWMANGKSKK